MWVIVAVAGALLGGAAPAGAVITAPVTIDGPSSEVAEFGGVAMAQDGSGGIVWVKAVDGVPHVFAARFVGGRWSGPIRVDWDKPYPATEPRIAAGTRGELLVVWDTEIATVGGKIQYGLFSAKIERGAESFGPSLPIDPNVGRAIGVDPSVAGTLPGQAIVAYRAINYGFEGLTTIDKESPFRTAVQLRPGDIMAEFRLARWRGDRWARLGAVNRNPESSVRSPTPTNGPVVDIAEDGSAAVAWQEPDQTRTDRIWLRRVFGTTPGPVLEASPATWNGRPVTADANAVSIAVSEFAQVRVAFRMANAPNSPLSGRVLVNSLQSSDSLTAGTLTGPVVANASQASLPPGGLGPPDVAVTDGGGAEGSMRLAYMAGSQLQQVGLNDQGAIVGVKTPAGSPGEPGDRAVVAVDPKGGGVVAYQSHDPAGNEVVAVRQESSSGAAQTALVSGALAGPVEGLAIGGSGQGDALVAFRQGEPGRYEIVVDRVGSKPASFLLRSAGGWVKPRQVKLRWQPPVTGVGDLSYSVLLDGRVVRAGLGRRWFRPRPSQLGNGVIRAQVLASDRLGQQTLSKRARLMVDGQPPSVRLRVRRGRALIRIRDPDSGLKAKSTKVRFGDGKSAHGGSRFSHRYQHAGRFRILVSAEDRAGNRVLRRFKGVRVR
ncbi:MAG TPA: hypothetical protein VH476_01255 [Solirubrobacterales bacterium]